MLVSCGAAAVGSAPAGAEIGEGTVETESHQLSCRAVRFDAGLSHFTEQAYRRVVVPGLVAGLDQRVIGVNRF